jgi:anhydro-N-acetylmuramic acid kinase
MEHPSAWTAIGIMSGTSLDGLDAVALSWDPETGFLPTAHAFRPWPAALRDTLLMLAEGGTAEAKTLAEAARGVSEAYAELALTVMEAARLQPHQVSVIGMHGQTLYHAPPPHGVTWQIGWPAWVATRTGIPTAGDFRVADVAGGGHGAPLAPLAHRHFFGHPKERRGVLNLGGIANLTVLSPGGAVATAFDTGPGNMIMDGLVADATAGRERFDQDGRLARRGTAHRALVERLLAHPYFRTSPPKSTGRELFGRPFRDAFRSLTLPDALATALVLTAESVAQAVAPFQLDRLIVAGGGARNPALMDALAARVACPVDPSDAYGFPAETVEAAAFAWLGYACLQGIASDTRSVTGGRPAVLGVLARVR